MRANAYLSFRGDCEAAFAFYAECLGGTVGQLFRYGGSPFEAEAPAGWHDKVMHGSVTIGGQDFMGADVAPDKYEKPRGVSLSLHIDDTAEAERVFTALARGGTIVMPLAKTFWAAHFGMLVDRFGIQWMVNGGGSEPEGGQS
jgi:PhnB protein